MIFPKPLIAATLLRRYKRFLADVRLGDGTELTVHCPNSGSMLGCADPGIAARISTSDKPNRKYPHTLEMVKPRECWVGINTSRTNDLVEEAVREGLIRELRHCEKLQREVHSSPETRLDFHFIEEGRQVFMEAKNCTLAENGNALFPDAVTSRGTKHLRELVSLRHQGARSIIFYLVQRMDVERFMAAANIDPTYAAALN
ncbi:MAG: DNA/RNA nuclease SfsA, partial [Deltaproteobacteria bacterium]